MGGRIKVSFLCGMMFLSAVSMAAPGSDVRLIEAVKKEDKEATRALLKDHVDVNASEADGSTALAWAAYRDDAEAVDLLIRAGANVNAANSYGVTPLSLACTNRNSLIVEKLLTAGANPNAAQSTGETPLMTCAGTGTVDAVNLIINHKGDVNVRETEKAQTPLMWAAAGKHADVVRVLIKNGADVNARTRDGFTPLMFAAQQGDLESVRVLLESGADLNAVAPKYGSALTVASASRNERVALFLLDKGADPNVADSLGITPLHYSIARGIADITNIAPTAAFDLSYRVRPSNMTRLAKALIAKKANPNAQIKKIIVTFGTTVALNGIGAPSMIDATPFFLAALSADVDLMRALLEAGADPSIKAQKNTTALLAAAGAVFDAYRSEEEKSKALEAVKLLVELGVDVNERNTAGQAPIHAAAFTGATAMVQFLADHGANVNVKARNGETPWSMASGVYSNAMNAAFWTVHEDTVALLVKLGATVLKPEEIEAIKSGQGAAYYAPQAK